jgi:hypothetical protein
MSQNVSAQQHPGQLTKLTVSLAIWTFCFAFAATASLLLVQRFSNPTISSPMFGQLLFTALVIAAVGFPVSRFAQTMTQRRDKETLRGLFTFSCLALAICLSIEGANPWGLTLTWLAAAFSVYLCWSVEIHDAILLLFPRPSGTSTAVAISEQLESNEDSPQPSATATVAPPIRSTESASDDGSNETAISSLEARLGGGEVYDDEEYEEEFEGLAADVQQQLTRTVEDQIDTLAVMQRVHFGQGERTANVHIAVCPPFATAPTSVDAFLLDDADVEIKVAEKESYGIRLELRLTSKQSSAVEATIQCIAQAPQADS